MKIRILSLVLATLAVCVVWQNAEGQHLLKHHQSGAPVCEPGFKMVEEIVMQDVVRHVCKNVTEYPKKWVYSTVDDPYCVLNSKHGQCPECSGPYCRQLLVKRQVDNLCLPPITKCVTETIVEKVAVTVYRKVPCDTPGVVETIPVKLMPVEPGKKK